jgi:ribose transport system permease protein
VLLVEHFVLSYTRFGRYVYMTGSNREAALLSGVNTKNIVAACLAISGFTAGAAGMLNT